MLSEFDDKHIGSRLIKGSASGCEDCRRAYYEKPGVVLDAPKLSRESRTGQTRVSGCIRLHPAIGLGASVLAASTRLPALGWATRGPQARPPIRTNPPTAPQEKLVHLQTFLPNQPPPQKKTVHLHRPLPIESPAVVLGTTSVLFVGGPLHYTSGSGWHPAPRGAAVRGGAARRRRGFAPGSQWAGPGGRGQAGLKPGADQGAAPAVTCCWPGLWR